MFRTSEPVKCFMPHCIYWSAASNYFPTSLQTKPMYLIIFDYAYHGCNFCSKNASGGFFKIMGNGYFRQTTSSDESPTLLFIIIEVVIGKYVTYILLRVL